MATRFVLDPRVRRRDRGRTVVGGAPRRVFRLTAAGSELLDRVDAGEVPPAGRAARRLVGRLLDTGVIHPRLTAEVGPAEGVTVVVPVRDRPAGLDRLLASVRAVSADAPVVVVDDGSRDPDAHAEVCRRHGATMLHRPVSGGPAAARNAGLAAVTTPFVAFCDSDVELGADWPRLLGHFEDDRVAMVAPRVRAVGGSGVLADFEADRSPLDLGRFPGAVAPGRSITYVPAAMVVARTAALLGLGGFDEGLRVGEDVDLVWRLAATGHVVRYEPGVEVRHLVREGWLAAARQRVGYGMSAALLEHRHPGEVAPLRVSPWSLAVWGPVAVRRPLPGLLAALGTGVALGRRLPECPDRTVIGLRLGLEGHGAAGLQLARAAVRPYWPLVVLLGVRRPRLAARIVMAAAVAAWWDRRERGASLPVWRYVPLALADDAAYGAGVWLGAWRLRSVRALLPRLTG